MCGMLCTSFWWPTISSKRRPPVTSCRVQGVPGVTSSCCVHCAQVYDLITMGLRYFSFWQLMLDIGLLLHITVICFRYFHHSSAAFTRSFSADAWLFRVRAAQYHTVSNPVGAGDHLSAIQSWAVCQYPTVREAKTALGCLMDSWWIVANRYCWDDRSALCCDIWNSPITQVNRRSKPAALKGVAG